VLEHAQRIAALLRQGKSKEARAVHNQDVESQLEAAKSGSINLSDPIAGKEAFIIFPVDRVRVALTTRGFSVRCSTT
jgi:hypothetical protein